MNAIVQAVADYCQACSRKKCTGCVFSDYVPRVADALAPVVVNPRIERQIRPLTALLPESGRVIPFPTTRRKR